MYLKYCVRTTSVGRYLLSESPGVLLLHVLKLKHMKMTITCWRPQQYICQQVMDIEPHLDEDRKQCGWRHELGRTGKEDGV